MDNKEFSKLAKQLWSLAKVKAKNEAIREIDESDFQLEIKNDQFGPRVQMYFFSENGGEIVFSCEYDIKNHVFKD